MSLAEQAEAIFLSEYTRATGEPDRGKKIVSDIKKKHTDSSLAPIRKERKRRVMQHLEQIARDDPELMSTRRAIENDPHPNRRVFRTAQFYSELIDNDPELVRILEEMLAKEKELLSSLN